MIDWIKTLFAEWRELVQIKTLLSEIKYNNERIYMKLEEAVAKLEETKINMQNISNDVDVLVQNVADLKAAALNADLPQAVADAITAVDEQSKVVDAKFPAPDSAPLV